MASNKQIVTRSASVFTRDSCFGDADPLCPFFLQRFDHIVDF